MCILSVMSLEVLQLGVASCGGILFRLFRVLITFVRIALCKLLDFVEYAAPLRALSPQAFVVDGVFTPSDARPLSQLVAMACGMEDIIPAPQTAGYRNKCEFTVGKDRETGEIRSGFRLGTFLDGVAVASGPHDGRRSGSSRVSSEWSSPALSSNCQAPSPEKPSRPTLTSMVSATSRREGRAARRASMCVGGGVASAAKKILV